MSENVFLVWCPDYCESEEDASKIEAFDAGEAATEWAEKSDSASADYSIVGGQEVTVMVKDCATGEVLRFCVDGESVPQYYAHEIMDAPNGEGKAGGDA